MCILEKEEENNESIRLNKCWRKSKQDSVTT